MAPRPQPNNATPQRLQLAPQTVPRMPFSSPMGEEVLSPTSPNASRSPPQHQIKLSQNRHGQENQETNTPGVSSQSLKKREQVQSQEAGENKSRWPGLNVVTNFSKPPTSARTAADGGMKTNAGLGLKKQPGAPIAASRKASVETLGLGHEPSPKSLKTLGSRGRLGDLKRASSKWSNLSPSDRAVLIGISVSPEEIARHSASPSDSPARQEGLSEQHAIDRRSATMPNIVITPAKENAPWSTDERQEEQPTKPHQTRAASSVYSQAFSHVGARPIDSAIVPPIPPLPPDVQSSFARNNKEPTKGQPSPRVLSISTEIDDNESTETYNEKMQGSGRSQLRVLTKTASMDSIATRHRSQGWWNHIVSPFFPKSPMNFKVPKEPMPEIPTTIQKNPNLSKTRRSSLPPPNSEGVRSSRTSFSDSTLDAEYEKRLELDGFHDRSTLIAEEPQEGLLRESALLPDKFEGFGAAAEYFEACLYDMHSETPYFECQNHVCLPPKGIDLARFEGQGSRTVGDNGGSREATGPGRGSEPPLAAQQAPTNRFSAAFLEAIKPNTSHRPKSDATVIEDLETTPDVQEAHVAPVVKAPAPIPAAQPPVICDLPEPGSTSSNIPNVPEGPSATSRPSAQAVRDNNNPPPKPSESTSRTAPIRTYSPSTHGSPLCQESNAEASPQLATTEYRLDPASTSSPPKQDKQPKRYVAVLPPENGPQPAFEQPLSPEPLSPGQQRQVPRGAIPLQPVYTDNLGLQHGVNTAEGKGSSGDREPAQTLANPFANPRDASKINTRRDAQYDEPHQTTVADLYPPPRDASAIQRSYQYREKDALPPREPKKRDPFASLKCRNCCCSAKPRNKKEKKMIMAIAVGLILLVILILVLVMTLTLRKKGHKVPVQAQWLNLTNFPPIPTGIATIVQPSAVEQTSDCIQPGTMWSCAVPKEEQQNISPNAPNQPNFRVEIVFQNGTNATTNSTTGNSSNIHRRSYRHAMNAVSAGGFIKNRLLHIRNAFSSNRYTPSPVAPSLEEQTFLGNTTERNAEPYDGEFTPFFMSFESADKLPSRRLRRSNSDFDDDSTPFPNSTTGIPPPDTNLDGTAAAANLYPYPSSQPLRLYDRGLDTEHYGFYTYFDRSIFLKSDSPLDDLSAGNTTSTPVPDDENGGAPANAASVRCTWAQTRFLVQIWTKKGNSAALLQPTNSTNSTTSSKPSSHHTGSNTTSLTSSTANDFLRPGSFPYPITIALDRHGGDITKKSVYCYCLDDREHYNTSLKQFQLEDRGVGGQLVNPALGPFGDVNVTRKEGGPGGIDGGSGGCGCKWQNFGTGL
ncbi:hypothetical protein ACLMJK_002706 [Lecanora helva]